MRSGVENASGVLREFWGVAVGVVLVGVILHFVPDN